MACAYNNDNNCIYLVFTVFQIHAVIDFNAHNDLMM